MAYLLLLPGEMFSPHSHSLLSRRNAALATTIFFVGALLSAQAHRVQVRHAYCSDHGELVHIERLPGQPGMLPGQGATRLHRDHQVQGVHGCLALSFITTPWLQPSPRGADAHLGAVEEPSAEPYTIPNASIPRLHQAPKQSPPTA